MDNRIFNINGIGEDMLKATLNLAFQQTGTNTKCKAWAQDEEHGLILLSWKEHSPHEHILPSALSCRDVLVLVNGWLSSEFAKSVKLSKWCDNFKHDGHNKIGWQVYCGDWGHVGTYQSAICAVKPAYVWYGK